MNLEEKPFYLNKEQIAYVDNTLAHMSLDDKIKQIFIDMAAPVNEQMIKNIVQTKKFGGIRYMNQDSKKLKELIGNYQKYSDIKLIVAANTEAGGNGACSDGTYIGQEIKIAATNDKKYAYELGRISAIEAKAIGCNTLFAPIVDINRNWRNPIVASRTFGSDPKIVSEYAKEYLRAAHENKVACVCKHFPGDGIDERDQHLTNSLNSLTKEEWDQSFGYVYKEMIEAGCEGIMAGHILLPSYEKYFNPNLKDNEYMPATLSPYLLKNLLREQLGFNGLIITDASHMVALTSKMKRSNLIARAIMSGCDMFLFYNDFEEDFNYVKESILNNELTIERLDEAVRRILAFKAHLNLDKPISEEDNLNLIGLDEYKAIQREVSRKAITLVKSIEANVLPISPNKYKKILVVHHDISNPFNSYITNKNSLKYYELFSNNLKERGFEVEIYTPVLEQLKNASSDEVREIMGKLYTSKSAIKSLTDKYDLVIHLANVAGNGVVQRLDFALTKGAIDIPWYVNELPVIFISMNCPFHLMDVAQVKTYINCYDTMDHTVDELVKKLVGEDEFMGVSRVNCFGSSEDTKW